MTVALKVSYLVCLVALLSSRFTAQGAPSVRVATYNIYFDNRNLDVVAQSIIDSKAEIVALQETAPSSETYLTSKLRGRLPYSHFRGNRGAYKAERLGFISKHPLVKIRFLPPQTGLFGTLLGTFQTASGEVQIANVHLAPVRLPNGGPFLEYLKAWSDSDEVRRKEIERVWSEMNTNIPRIIAGDFNSLSTGEAPDFLRKKDFVDSFAAVTSNADQHASWSFNSGPVPLHFRLDYIFHDTSCKTLKSQILTNSSSDHYLVVSEIQAGPSAQQTRPPAKR